MCFPLLPYSFETERNAQLSDSVPPAVKYISSFFAPSVSAIRLLASSIAFLLFPANESLYNGDLAISLGINWGNMGGFGDGWYLVEIGDLGLDFVGLNPIVLTDQGPAFSNQDWSRAVKLLTDIRPDNMD